MAKKLARIQGPSFLQSYWHAAPDGASEIVALDEPVDQGHGGSFERGRWAAAGNQLDINHRRMGCPNDAHHPPNPMNGRKVGHSPFKGGSVSSWDCPAHPPSRVFQTHAFWGNTGPPEEKSPICTGTAGTSDPRGWPEEAETSESRLSYADRN